MVKKLKVELLRRNESTWKDQQAQISKFFHQTDEKLQEILPVMT